MTENKKAQCKLRLLCFVRETFPGDFKTDLTGIIEKKIICACVCVVCVVYIP